MDTKPQSNKLNDHLTYISQRSLPLGAAGLGLGYFVNRALVRKMPKFFGASTGVQTMTIASFGIAFLATSAEIASRKYELAEMDAATGYRRNRVALPSTPVDRFVDMLKEYKFTAITAAWAGAMGVSGWYVSRDKYMNFQQKLVQARMYAQGFTILLILGVAGVSMLEGDAPKLTEAEQRRYNEAQIEEAMAQSVREDPAKLAAEYRLKHGR
ncbi:uncharacterized protein V1510DRAFT_409903 [Dipodascopsis tothii]|uniref:uncharacterized protein n=1 Tax=Dipodascopsis tothii TaxID=44089 RepID=UPI0034CF7B84